MHRAQEIALNTDEQVETQIRKALTLLDVLDTDGHTLSGELEVAVFLKAVELYSQKQVFFEEVRPLGVPLG